MHYLIKTLPVLAVLAIAIPVTASAHERSATKSNFDDSVGRPSASHQQSLPSYDAKHHDTYRAKVDARQERQWRRIKQGVRSGELNRKEVKKLKRQQRKIAGLERSFFDDGRLSRKERRVLMDRLDAASERIYRLKHNDRQSDGYDSAHR